MPHKKNPDVFELIRSHCNRIKALPNEIMMMTTNLPSGYHRDLQLLKEHLFPAFDTLKNCIAMASLMLQNTSVRENILEDEKYKYLFSVEAVNALVSQGMPFREAYQQTAADIEAGNFKWDRPIEHTHEGSIGNLQTKEIRQMMDEVLERFDFATMNAALLLLLKKQ